MLNGKLASSNQELIRILIRTIRDSATGAISFREYMQRCLYEPGYGYYMTRSPKVGRSGDFYTSSNVGTLMGEMLAAYFVRYWAQYPGLPQFRIVEWGGGSGRLAGQVMDEIQIVDPKLYEKLHYDIVDKSGYHRELQEETTNAHAKKTSLHDPDEWTMNDLPERTIVISNELLDAFPIHRLQYAKDRYHECYVEWNDGEGCFNERWMPLESGSPLFGLLEEHSVPDRMAEGQMLEVNVGAANWIKQTAGKLASGMLVTMDYGDLSERLYSPNRMRGTFMCYYRHSAHDDPFVHVGLQDMTAHVNFSSCIKAGLTAGLKEWTLETQQRFLVNAGILERLREHNLSDPFHPIAKRNRAIRQLLLGDSMGETFKVLVQKKDD